jgi:hypothetical protein
MALIITKQKDVRAYYDSDRVSQSLLKEMAKGFSSFLKYQNKEEETTTKSHFVVGSSVDTILTGEEGEFENQFYISDVEIELSDVEKSMVSYVFDELTDNDVPVDMSFRDYPNSIQNAIIEQDWYKGNPGSKRTEGFVEKGDAYFEMLKASYGKQIVNLSQNYVITEVVNSLREHPNTSSYFDRSLYINNINVDIYYQLPIFFTHEGVECKALLDMLLVFRNPDTDKIESVLPVDLKTMSGDTVDFIKSVKQWRYDIQASWYSLAVEYWMEAQGIPSNQYVLRPFQFVVKSTTDLPSAPLMFEVSENLLTIGQFGREAIYLDELMLIKSQLQENIQICWEIRGYVSLLDEYVYYCNQGWKEDKRIAESNGVLKLDWDGLNL